jgi:superfamily I DNA/RNA helicase
MDKNPFVNSAIQETSFDEEDTIVSTPTFFLTSDHREALKKYVGGLSLDHDQRLVCDAPREGVHKILAGAGSGKTFSLIARALNILAHESDVNPNNMVLITFTNKAGREIKKRFQEALQRALQMEFPPMPFIGTIHSFAYNLIASNEGHNQTILSEAADLSLLRRSIRYDLFPEQRERWREANIRVLHEQIQKIIVNNELHFFTTPLWIDDAVKVLPYTNPIWESSVRDRYNYLDATCRTIITNSKKAPVLNDFLKKTIRNYYATEAGISVPDLIRLLTHLLTVRYNQRTFDFADILYYPLVYLLNHPVSLKRAQDKYKHWFLDEAQDMDTLQFALCRLIYGK